VTSGDDRHLSDEQDAIVHALETSCEQVQTPLGRMEHGLSSWISFLILPLFALSNAGVKLTGDIEEMLFNPRTLGVAVALPIGKAIGITAFSWLAVKLRLAMLPDGATWGALHGVAWLGGIGFTMSLFIAGLAFSDAALLAEAKVGVLLASILAAVIGWMLLGKLRIEKGEGFVETVPNALLHF